MRARKAITLTEYDLTFFWLSASYMNILMKTKCNWEGIYSHCSTMQCRIVPPMHCKRVGKGIKQIKIPKLLQNSDAKSHWPHSHQKGNCCVQDIMHIIQRERHFLNMKICKYYSLWMPFRTFIFIHDEHNCVMIFLLFKQWYLCGWKPNTSQNQ